MVMISFPWKKNAMRGRTAFINLSFEKETTASLDQALEIF